MTMVSSRLAWTTLRNPVLKNNKKIRCGDLGPEEWLRQEDYDTVIPYIFKKGIVKRAQRR